MRRPDCRHPPSLTTVLCSAASTLRCLPRFSLRRHTSVYPMVEGVNGDAAAADLTRRPHLQSGFQDALASTAPTIFLTAIKIVSGTNGF